MSPVATCREMRLRRDIPIIVTSAAHGLRLAPVPLRELGMQAVVAMPFDLDALIGIVQRYTPSSATQTVTETGGNDCRRNCGT